MEIGRWLLAGVAGAGLFAAGYLTRGLTPGDPAVSSGVVAPAENRRHGPDALATPPERNRTKPARKAADERTAGYRKIVQMMSEGKIQIAGVRINGESFLPDEKVAEFFGLSEAQITGMKQIGRERLRKKQDREHERATIQEVSENGMVADLPADPEFAAAEAAAFTEDLRGAFGSDVAGMLRPSIEQAYREAEAPRHIRYTLTRQEPLEDLANAPAEVRAVLDNQYDFKVSVNQNEGGSFMTDDEGMIFRGSSSVSGSFSPDNTNPDHFLPPYHDLWERAMGRK